MIPVTFDAAMDLVPAFPGMIADSMFTDKHVVPCGATPQPFGTVVASVSGTGISVLPIGANVLEGIALHDHALAGGHDGQGGYGEGNPISVVRRGRVWALASDDCTKDAPARFDPETGAFTDDGTATYPRARFLSGRLVIPDVVVGGAAVQVVLVELAHPTVDAVPAPEEEP
jgi:hypothetical protein